MDSSPREERILTSLPGLISDEQGLMLARYASAVPATQTIVEIGSYKGKSTCYLAYGAGAGGAPVYAVDPWDQLGNHNGRFGFAQLETYLGFLASVHALDYGFRIHPVRMFSTDAALLWGLERRGASIGLLYIDGDHTEGAVEADYQAWLPHLHPSATVIFDDLDTPRNPGVRVVVDRVRKAQQFRSVHVEGRCAVFSERVR